MSYIRYGHPMVYVEGNSDDYVYPAVDGKGNTWIEDYGQISDGGFIELLYQEWKTEDL